MGMRKRDKFNLLSDPISEKIKSDKDKQRNKDYHKARNKGTGRQDRSYHRKMEDL